MSDKGVAWAEPAASGELRNGFWGFQNPGTAFDAKGEASLTEDREAPMSCRGSRARCSKTPQCHA